MCYTIRKKLFRCFIAVLLVLSFSFSVSAESEYDYSSPMRGEFQVVEELLDQVNYRICSCDILHEDIMGGFNLVTAGACASAEKLRQKTEYKAYQMDQTTKTDRFPESYLDIVNSYDKTFFEENFLAVAYVLLRKTDEFTIKRIDHIKTVSPYSQEYSVSVVLDFDDIPGDEYIEGNLSVFCVFLELPKKYYISEGCVVGLQESWVEYNGGNPKTGDNAMLFPAMGAMVTAAAGILITKKRKK